MESGLVAWVAGGADGMAEAGGIVGGIGGGAVGCWTGLFAGAAGLDGFSGSALNGSPEGISVGGAGFVTATSIFCAWAGCNTCNS